ncbi:MAG: hypothetical protein QOE55_543 [Acidobacteriaceae bacterium]|nr:hypothetical protein [Acidobacteriaceae bacterium]
MSWPLYPLVHSKWRYERRAIVQKTLWVLGSGFWLGRPSARSFRLNRGQQGNERNSETMDVYRDPNRPQEHAVKKGLTGFYRS